MRDVSFKAWDTKNEMLTNFMIIDNMLQFMDKATGVWIRDDKQERFKLLAYTGLNDKKGREIYEGDICSWAEPGFRPGEFVEGTFEVKWDDRNKKWIAISKYGDNDLYEYDDGSIRYVIGNIYEDKNRREQHVGI